MPKRIGAMAASDVEGRKLRWAAYAASVMALIGFPMVWFGKSDGNATFLSEFQMRLLTSAILLGLPAALLTAARREERAQAEFSARQHRHPGQPWLWREDWEHLAIRDEASFRRDWYWPAIIGLGGLPVLAALPSAVRYRHPGVILAAVVVVALLTWFLYRVLRRVKYGTSICRVEAIPIVPGATFRGVVETTLARPPADGFRVTLSFTVEHLETDLDNRTVQRRDVVWRDEQVVRSSEIGPRGIAVRVSCEIPPDARSLSQRFVPPGQERWWLEVSAATPGINYASKFELPVFPQAT
ncbi:MAG: hypothetical protein HY651_11625 [Acidobacteria bacterium]|nr:hypothetical protein [Acidobacteriota bacterium]